MGKKGHTRIRLEVNKGSYLLLVITLDVIIYALNLLITLKDCLCFIVLSFSEDYFKDLLAVHTSPPPLPKTILGLPTGLSIGIKVTPFFTET